MIEREPSRSRVVDNAFPASFEGTNPPVDAQKSINIILIDSM
jgi:hypothetical protein